MHQLETKKIGRSLEKYCKLFLITVFSIIFFIVIILLCDIHIFDDLLFRYVAASGYTKSAKLLIEMKADVHSDDDQALKLASMEGHSDTVKMLVEYGANVHASQDFALFAAVGKNYPTIVKILISKDGIKSGCKEVWLQFAKRARNPEISDLLKKYSINLPACPVLDAEKMGGK